MTEEVYGNDGKGEPGMRKGKQGRGNRTPECTWRPTQVPGASAGKNANDGSQARAALTPSRFRSVRPNTSAAR